MHYLCIIGMIGLKVYLFVDRAGEKEGSKVI